MEHLGILILLEFNTVVSRKYAPPFATLALEMFSGSVDAAFVLALPFHHGDLETDCVGVSKREGSGGRA